MSHNHRRVVGWLSACVIVLGACQASPVAIPTAPPAATASVPASGTAEPSIAVSVPPTLLQSTPLPPSTNPTPTSTRAPTAGPSASASAEPPGATGRILFLRFPASGQPEHFVVSADGSDEQPFGPSVDYETRQVSRDESLLAIVGMNSQGMIVGGTIGVDGTGFGLFKNPEPSLNLACGIWAPEDRMACEAWNDNDPSLDGIWTVRASDGSDPAQLTSGRDVPCDFSPDGSQLALLRESPDGNGSTLMVTGSKVGHEPVALLEDVAGSGLPCDWSPDGSEILTATTDGKLQLVTAQGDSTIFVGVGLDGYITNGVWSPDGSHILLTMALQGEQGDVYSIAADGSDLQRITNSDLLEEGLTWLP